MTESMFCALWPRRSLLLVAAGQAEAHTVSLVLYTIAAVNVHLRRMPCVRRQLEKQGVYRLRTLTAPLSHPLL